MKWRKEYNSWTNHSLRFALTYQERDIYYCLRSIAGSYVSAETMDRQGYIERSDGIPYSVNQISALIGEDAVIIKCLMDKLEDMGILEIDGECYRFTNWEYIDNTKSKKRQFTPREQEYFDKSQFERLTQKYPELLRDIMDSEVEREIVNLVNKGKIKYIGDEDAE